MFPDCAVVTGLRSVVTPAVPPPSARQNKNKSKQVQKYVQSVTVQVKNMGAKKVCGGCGALVPGFVEQSVRTAKLVAAGSWRAGVVLRH